MQKVQIWSFLCIFVKNIAHNATRLQTVLMEICVCYASS